jgi:FMN phosphatase YigB (HAD superfamily)
MIPPLLSFNPTIGVSRVTESENGKVFGKIDKGSVDLICLDFDGCLSLQPLTADSGADIHAYIQSGGMGSSERLAEIRDSLRLLKERGKRICVLSLNKTLRIKVLLGAIGFGDYIEEVYGSDSPPYGATKAQRMLQLTKGGRSAILFDDSLKHVGDAARAGFGSVLAAPVSGSMLKKIL